MATKLKHGDYVSFARHRILDLVETELAVGPTEAQAKLGEKWHTNAQVSQTQGNLDQHITREAWKSLVAADEITIIKHASRGGHAITLAVPRNQYRRKTAIERAVERKASLLARYESWTKGNERYPHGLIGPAGEEAVNRAILRSGALQTFVPGGGPTREILGVKLTGSLDNGGWLTNTNLQGQPTPYAVLIEVKNIRQWIYPHNAELYQLLHTATVLQQALPDVKFVPILVCRKVHAFARMMAKEMGFFLIDMDQQFILDDVEQKSIDEVRKEIGFTDLALIPAGGSIRVYDRLTKSIPQHFAQSASLWHESAMDPTIGQAFIDLDHQSGQVITARLPEIERANVRLGRRTAWKK